MDEAWLNTVRMARDCGDISSLFPEGITRLYDLPHTLHTAIRTALYFLKFEELSDERDIPPKHIWLDGEKMSAWWEEVKRAQKERAESPDGSAYRDMPQNALLKEMFPGVKFNG